MAPNVKLTQLNEELEAWHARVAQVQEHVSDDLGQKLQSLSAQVREHQAAFSAEAEKAQAGIEEKLEAVKQQNAAVRQRTAATKANTRPLAESLPVIRKAPPTKPSNVDLAFGLKLRQELLDRFGKHAPSDDFDSDREIWEDWNDGGET